MDQISKLILASILFAKAPKAIQTLIQYAMKNMIVGIHLRQRLSKLNA